MTAALPEADAAAAGDRRPGAGPAAAASTACDVDLVVVATGALAPAEAVDRRAELGEAAAVALSAVSDAEAVRAVAGAGRPRSRGWPGEVKAWARARGLDSAPFGGLPGLAWSVLAARTVRERGDLSPRRAAAAVLRNLGGLGLA